MTSLFRVLRSWIAIALLTVLVIAAAYQIPYAYSNDLVGCVNGDWANGFEKGGWLENDDYCWLTKNSSMSFPYVAQDQPYQLVLRLAAGMRHAAGQGTDSDAFSPDIPTQPLEIWVNGARVETLDVKGGWNPYRIRLDPAEVASNGDLEIRLVEPASAAATETGAAAQNAPSLAIARVRLLDSDQSGPRFIMPPLLYVAFWTLLVGWGWAVLTFSPLKRYGAVRLLILLAALALLARFWSSDRLRLSLSLPYVIGLLAVGWFLVTQIPVWRAQPVRAPLQFLHTLGIADPHWRAVVEWSIVAVLAGDMFLNHIWPLRTHSLFDLVAYYAGTQVWMNGGDYYDAAVLADHIKNNALLAGTNRFVYPPFAILLFVPLAVISLPDAKTAWLILDCLWLIGTGILLYLTLRRSRFKLSPVWFMFLILTRPVGDGIGTGQVAILILFLFALGLYAWSENRPIIAGSTIALAAGLKVFPALLVPYFLFRRDWRAVGAAVVTGLVFLVTGLLAGGVTATWKFFTEVLPAFTSGAELTYNQSVNGALLRLLGVERGSWQGQPLPDPPIVRLGTLLIAAVLVGLTVWWFSRIQKPDALQRAIEFGAVIALVLLVLPIVWENYLSWLALPAILVLHALANHPFSIRAQLLVLLALVSSWIFLQFGPIWYDSPGLPTAARSLGLVAALLTYFSSLYVLRHVAEQERAADSKSQPQPLPDRPGVFRNTLARQ